MIKYALYIEPLKRSLTSRKNALAIILLVIYFLFLNQILSWYDTKIVYPLLSKVNVNHWTGFLMFVLVELTAIYFIEWYISERKIRVEIVFVTTFLLANYLWFRFFDNRYVALYKSGSTTLPYSDYIIFLFGGILILKLLEWLPSKREPYNPNTPFLIDKPLAEGEMDIFGRRQFAKRMAEKMQSKLRHPQAGALAIGINGAYGSGKTSFFHLIREYVSTDDKIIIDLNTWRSSSPEKIIEDFFDSLTTVLSPHYPYLSRSISKYGRTLTHLQEGFLSKLSSSALDFFFDEKSNGQMYEEINTSIASINKQIIIFIDDVDRLDTKEIMEVLRLIRNTANFNNVVYIVAYDRNYVVEAIKEFNSYNHNQFLEKIFQFEFSLPKFSQSTLREKIKEQLKSEFDDQAFLVLSEGIDDNQSGRGEYFTDLFIKTQRDVIRLSNAILFEIETIKYDVQLMDFYYLQLLKIKFPAIHESIYRYKTMFFIVDNGKLRLRTTDERDINENSLIVQRLIENKNPPKAQGVNAETFSQFLNESDITNSLSDQDRDQVFKLVKRLLQEKDYNALTRSVLYNSFCYDRNFEKYFTYSLLSKDLSTKEFDEARKLTWDEYKSRIDAWLNQGRHTEILNRLNHVKDFNTRKDWENELFALIHLARFKSKEDPLYAYTQYQQILAVMSIPMRDQNSTIFGNKERYKQYIRDFFNAAPDPYIFEGNLLITALSGYAELPLTSEEIDAITLRYLEQYCDQSTSVTPELNQVLRNCIRTNSYGERSKETVNRARATYREHVKKYLSPCDLGRFIEQDRPDSEYYKIQQEELQFVFDIHDEFKSWMTDAFATTEDKSCKEEMEDFLSKIEANSFMPISYEFKFLKPVRWIPRQIS